MLSAHRRRFMDRWRANCPRFSSTDERFFPLHSGVDRGDGNLLRVDGMLGQKGIGGAAVAVLLVLGLTRAARAQCVDENLKEELIGGRHYRGVQDRLFTKALRHE